MANAKRENMVKLALSRLILATFNKSKWLELGLLTNTDSQLNAHPRLFKALSFGDDDYQAAILEVLPIVLGEVRTASGSVKFRNLTQVEDYVDLAGWLASNDFELYERLYGDTIPIHEPRRRPDTASSDDEWAETSRSSRQSPKQDASRQRSSETRPVMRSVFLVHGRDMIARDALVELLRAFDLRVVDWDEASRATGVATPYTGDVISAGMRDSDVVIVLFTPDDIAQAHPRYHQPNDPRDELEPTGQARLNVVFEAGMAMALDRDRVVLVEVGAVRAMSDTAGLNVLRLKDDTSSRRRLASRLRTAGLAVHTDHDDWQDAGNFGASPSLVSALPLTSLAASSETEVVPAVRPPSDDLRTLLQDPNKALDLEEYVLGRVRDTATRLKEFRWTRAIDGEQSEALFESLLTQTQPALDVVVNGVRYDRRHEHSALWARAIQILMSTRQPPEGVFYDDLESLRHLPALFVLRAAGVTAVHYEYDSALVSMLREARWRDWQNPQVKLAASSALHEMRVIRPEMVNQFPRWNGTRWLYPASHYLREVLREPLRVAIPDDADYRDACDGYEYRVALVQWRYSDEPLAFRSAPGEFIGERRWTSEGVPMSEAEFLDSPQPIWGSVLGDNIMGSVVKLRGDLEKLQRWG
ncbi:TIR domain-containing protein [Angustibacter speluncae]